MSPAQDAELLARVNVDGTRRLLEAAGAVGVRHVVYTSSAMVYGAWSDNPLPITEEAAVRPIPGFTYAAQKAEAERLLVDWRSDHPGATVAVLRPAAAPGAAQDSWLARVWRGSAPAVRVRGEQPPVQYVHEDDLAEAVGLAVRAGLEGVYNVAPDGWINGDQARALAPGVRLALPERLARKVVGAGWRTGLSDITPAVLPYTVHPWVVANDRLRAAGWEPAHSNEETFVAGSQLPSWRAFLTRHRQAVALGATGAGITGIATTVVLLVRRARRRARG
jgi:nucleoside-diphosphate-sugar epimerase